MTGLSGCLPAFGEIAAQDASLRFERRGYLQILTASLEVSFSNSDESTSQPAIGKSAIQGDRLVERGARLTAL